MDTGSLFTYSLLHKTQGSSCWRAQCTGRHRTGSNIGVRLSCCKQACGTLQCLTSHCSIAGRRHSSLSAPCQHHPHRREWHWWHQNLMPNMFKAWNQDGQWHSFWVPLCHFIRPALQQRIYRCDVCRVQLIVRIVQCYESRTIPWKRFHQKKLRKNKERKFERRIKTELIHERCDGAPHAPLIRLRSFGQKKLIGFLQAKSFFFCHQWKHWPTYEMSESRIYADPPCSHPWSTATAYTDSTVSIVSKGSHVSISWTHHSRP